MKIKRPSTSPGIILHHSPPNETQVQPTPSSSNHRFNPIRPFTSRSFTSRPATAHPTTGRPNSRGSTTLPNSNAITRFAMPWETTEPPIDPVPFDEHEPPTEEQLDRASRSLLLTETGVRVAFGSLWQHQKTIVIFIRHFLCPMCQDYVHSISHSLTPEALRRDGLKLVIVSNGHHDFIKSYRKIFKCPFDIYTDPEHGIYEALGMTLQTMEKGPRPAYIRHGMIRGIGMVLGNAVKAGMPIWRNGGEISQLGGEFVLGPGLKCSFTHRMRYTRAHLPIEEVVEKAKISHPDISKLPDILVIGNDYQGFRNNMGRRSVLEVFHQDHRDEEDEQFIRLRAKGFIRATRGSWVLPSHRKCWIIEEDDEALEADKAMVVAVKDRGIEEVSSRFERDSFTEEASGGGTESIFEGHSIRTYSEVYEASGSTRASSDEGRVIDHDDEDTQSDSESVDGMVKHTNIDWRQVRRGSVQWRSRARSNTVGTTDTTYTTNTVRSEDVPPGFKNAMKNGYQSEAVQTIARNVDSSDTGSDGTDDSEGQVCEAFVLKLLPELDLGASLHFDELDWFRRSSTSLPGRGVDDTHLERTSLCDQLCFEI